MPPAKKKTATKKRVSVKTAKKPAAKKAPAKKKPVAKKRVPVKKKPAVKKPPVIEHEPGAVPLAMYRHIALAFVVVVAIALMGILYLATMQAVIHVDPVETVVSAEFIVNGTETQTSELEIPSEIIVGTIGKTETFMPNGDGTKEVFGVAIGQVTIYNDMSSSQPLVATTRLLTPDDVLFRIKEDVTVPANGSVVVGVYADEEGASGDVEPTTFTIPGLSAAKQALVYAANDAAFTGGVSLVSVVSAEEMEAAASGMEEVLLEDAKYMLWEESSQEYAGEVFDIEVVEKTYSIEPDSEAESYDVTITLQIGAVFYDEVALDSLAEMKIYEGLGQGQEFVDTGVSDMGVVLEGYNDESGIASLHVTLDGRAIASRASDALEVDRFVGMTEEEVKTLLVDEGVAEDVSVDFFPIWVSKIPRLQDHVYIEID